MTSHNPSTLALAAFTLLPILLLIKYIQRAYFSPLSRIPSPPLASASSLWGLWHVIKKDKFYAVDDAFKKYGPVVRVAPNTVAISDWRVLKEVYMTKLDKIPAYAGFATNHGVPNAFSAIITAEASGKRRGMLPHYATSNLIPWQDVIDDHLRELVAAIKGNGFEVDILSLGAHALVDILGEIVLDTKIGAISDFISGRPSFLPRTISLWPKRGTLKGNMGPLLWSIAERLPGKEWQELVKSDATLANFVAPLVYKALEKPDEATRPCLINRLAASKDNYTGALWNVEHVISECVDHFLAGTETTSTTLAYILWRLSVQKDVMETLQKELDENMETGDSLLSINEAARLPYLNGVIKEGLRLFAPVPGTLDRIVPPGGLDVHGFFLPEGTCFGMQAYTCHRDPEVWVDAEEFKPERWLEPTPEMLAAYIPFSIGSRNCPGMNIAYTDLRLLAATIARNFSITPSAETTDASMHPVDMTAINPVSGKVKLDFVYRG